MLCNVPFLTSLAGCRGIREIFEPRTIRVWRDSSTNAQPCFLSHRLSSLAFTLNGNHLWLLCQSPTRVSARLNNFNRRLFTTTLTELAAIAALAITGLRNPNAAAGIAITL
jgi:hypothetical protein